MEKTLSHLRRLAEEDRSNLIVAALGVLAAYCFFRLLRTYWRHHAVPGPFWAKFTNLQRIAWVKSRRAHEIHVEMHEKYGDVVRFGPNMISISDPAAIPTVYPMRPGFPKGNFYRSLMPYTKGGGALPAVFNTRDEKLHKQIKNPIAPIFSLSNVVTFERFVNDVLAVLFHQLDERFIATGQVFDLGEWLQYFAFDVMGTLTFSSRYGFLETGQDVHGILATIWTYMVTAAPMTQIPWFDQLWYKNRFTATLMAPFRPTTGFGILSIVGKLVNQRTSMSAEAKNAEAAKNLNDRDMLSRFMEIQRTNPSVPPWAVTAWSFSNVIAGSDSTGVVMRTTWYNLTAHPATMQRLYDELRAMERATGLTRPFPTWSEIHHLPYLDACIQEAVRLHPPFCLPFERVVPAEGVTICGRYFSGGTVVGISPWVANRHEPTFGADAEEWRPERWLGHSDEQRRKMEGSVLTFGAGRRVCLGKYVAMLELKKLTSALVLNYEIENVDPKAFTVENSWFFKQKGLNVRIKRRASVE